MPQKAIYLIVIGDVSNVGWKKSPVIFCHIERTGDYILLINENLMIRVQKKKCSKVFNSELPSITRRYLNFPIFVFLAISVPLWTWHTIWVHVHHQTNQQGVVEPLNLVVVRIHKLPSPTYAWDNLAPSFRLLIIAQKMEKKMKILCLHGFRTSGSFLKKQISKWDPSIFAQFDLVC